MNQISSLCISHLIPSAVAQGFVPRPAGHSGRCVQTLDTGGQALLRSRSHIGMLGIMGSGHERQHAQRPEGDLFEFAMTQLVHHNWIQDTLNTACTSKLGRYYCTE